MILNFFQRVIELKTVPRQGWKNKLGLNDVESVAEHTYSTAILSMIFSDLHGFDTEKIIKMALIHDLAESVIGDLTPNQIPKNKKNKLENAAMKQILKNLPKKISNDYYHIWDEYQKKSSNESILLHEIDKLEMALQAKFYQDQGISKKDLRSFFVTADAQITNKHLRHLFRSFLE